MYDRFVRPSAASQPDIARRFEVPQHISVWNQPQVAGTPDGRMSLEDLKASTLSGVAAMKQDRYMSMPLEGRVDLLMPKGDTASSPDHSDRDRDILHGKPAASVNHTDADSTNPPQTIVRTRKDIEQENLESPAEKSAWDAAHYPAPKNSRPEMAIPMTTIYAPAWDEPSSASAVYFEGMVETSLDYPTLPENVLSNDWYGDITATRPDPRMVSNVFPWESDAQSRPAATRRFPQDRPAEDALRDALPSGDLRSPESSSESASEAHSTEHNRSQLHGASEGGRNEHTESGASNRCHPALSFAESMASYTNAWDEVASIHTYAQRLTALGIGVERRAQTSGLETTVGTPRGTSTPPPAYQDHPSRRRSPSSSSADGDDEDERGRGLHAKASRRRTPTYRDREAQTERLGVDAMVQTTTGPPEAVGGRAPLTVSPAEAPRPSHSRQHSSRSWNPTTDIDLRRQDSAEVLHRLMKTNVGPGLGM